jgi:site-specific recombinase XerD
MNIREFEEKKEQFLIYITQKKNRAAYTARAYRTDLQQFHLFWQDTLTEKPEIDLLEALSLFVEALYNRTIDRSSIARKISCLNSFKKFLAEQGIVIPLSLKRPYVPAYIPAPMDLLQINNLLEKITPEAIPTKHPLRDIAILNLFYETGIRSSELVAAEVQALNLFQKTITIRGKRIRERVVSFSDKTKVNLEHYLKRERAPISCPEERLFINRQGAPITTRSVQRMCAMFRQFLQEKYPITPHLLRHSHAVHLLQSGIDIEVVQELLGHKTRASTQRYTQAPTWKQFRNSSKYG